MTSKSEETTTARRGIVLAVLETVGWTLIGLTLCVAVYAFKLVLG